MHGASVFLHWYTHCVKIIFVSITHTRILCHTCCLTCKHLWSLSFLLVPLPGSIPDKHPLLTWTRRELISLTAAGGRIGLPLYAISFHFDLNISIWLLSWSMHGSVFSLVCWLSKNQSQRFQTLSYKDVSLVFVWKYVEPHGICPRILSYVIQISVEVSALVHNNYLHRIRSEWLLDAEVYFSMFQSYPVHDPLLSL